MGSAQTVPRSGYIVPLVTATGIVLVTSRSACEDVGVRQCKHEQAKTQSTLHPNSNGDQVRNKGAG